MSGGRPAAEPGTVLVVAGSDPLGLSGLQADLRHLGAVGIGGMGVPTCLTEQSAGSVEAVRPVDPAHVARAIALALEDGSVRAVKIGLVPRPEIVGAVAAALRRAAVPIVLDPVLSAGRGGKLLEEGTVPALLAELLPIATVLTPNLPELEALLRSAGIESPPGTGPRAQALRRLGPPWVYVKGGHDPAGGVLVRDLLAGGGTDRLLAGPRHPGRTPRGTGCALSTLLAAGLAAGLGVPEAAASARELVGVAIGRALAAGSDRLVMAPAPFR